MDERILAAAHHVSDSGDACFAGEGPEVLVVHDQQLAPGDIYRSPDGSIAVRIVRSATREEYLERCSHVPVALNLSRCFFHVGVAD